MRGSPRAGRGAAGAGPEAAGGSVEKPQRCPGEPCGSPAAPVPPAGCRRLRVPVGASPGGAALLPAAAEPTPEELSLRGSPGLVTGICFSSSLAVGVRAGSGEFHPAARPVHRSSVPSALGQLRLYQKRPGEVGVRGTQRWGLALLRPEPAGQGARATA